MQRRRFAVALAASMLASIAIAPATGAFQDNVNTAPTDEWFVNDSAGLPGVRCKFEDNPGTKKDEVNKIVVGSFQTHGHKEQKTWVGRRIIVKANTKPYSDGKFRPVKRSKINKQKANQLEVAFWSGWTWKTPENNKSRYRVVIEMIYYKPGSKTKVIGRIKGPMDVYAQKQGAAMATYGTEGGPTGWCWQKWSAVS